MWKGKKREGGGYETWFWSHEFNKYIDSSGIRRVNIKDMKNCKINYKPIIVGPNLYHWSWIRKGECIFKLSQVI